MTQTALKALTVDYTTKERSQHETRWHKDIATYDDLVAFTDTVSKIQTILMEFIREGKTYLARDMPASGNTNASFDEDSCDTASPHTEVLNALRAKGRQMCQSGSPSWTFENIQAAEIKLRRTDEKMKSAQQRMRLLERRILTHEPVDQYEATDMLSFMARLFKANGKVDNEYLSDILEACAAVSTRHPTTSQRKVYQRLAVA